MDVIATLVTAAIVLAGIWAVAALLIFLHRPSRELVRPALALPPNIVLAKRGRGSHDATASSR